MSSIGKKRTFAEVRGNSQQTGSPNTPNPANDRELRAWAWGGLARGAREVKKLLRTSPEEVKLELLEELGAHYDQVHTRASGPELVGAVLGVLEKLRKRGAEDPLLLARLLAVLPKGFHRLLPPGRVCSRCRARLTTPTQRWCARCRRGRRTVPVPWDR